MQENTETLHDKNPIPAPEPTKTANWKAAAQLILSIIAGLGFWGMALTFALFGIAAYFVLPMGEAGNLSMNAASLILLAVSLFWMGALVLPSAYYAGKRLRGEMQIPPPAVRPVSLIALAVSVGIIAFSLWLGNTFGKEAVFAAFILPFLHILAISLPIFWTAVLANSGIPRLKTPRMWGALAASLTLGPFIIMLLEITAMLMFSIVAVVVLLARPEWMREISQIGLRLSYAVDQAGLEQIILPFLAKPAVILSLLFFVAVIVPLIEEAIKPIGVWLLLPAGLNGRQGFVIGLISGAGYALFESLLLATASSDWVAIVIGRAATGVLHIANCGLVGWALAEAFGVKPRPKGTLRRLWGAYLLAVMLHGLWNGLTVFSLWGTLVEKTAAEYPTWLIELGKIAPYGLTLTALAAFCVLCYENFSMRRRLALPKDGASSGGLTPNNQKEKSWK